MLEKNSAHSDQQSFKLDFVGIGAPKCATTWLYECLREHPQIYVAPKDQAETNFFGEADYQERIEDYRSFFRPENTGAIKGNFEVWYIHSETAAERIKEHNPRIKILVSLRNPINRAYSQYIHGSSLGKRTWKSFEDAIKQNPEPILELGLYYKQLKKYFDLFPRENISILIYEDIKKDPFILIKEVYDFLGADSSFVPQYINRVVAPSKFKLTRLGRLVHKGFYPIKKRTKLGRRIKNSFAAKKYFNRFAEFYVGRKKAISPIKAETLSFLKNFYQKDTEKLERLIGRDLALWK